MSTPTDTPTHILRDQHGLAISATSEATELYDRALDRLLRYHPDLVPLATQLSEEHGDVAMSNAFVAYLHLSSTARGDVDVARAAWAAMAATPMGPASRPTTELSAHGCRATGTAPVASSTISSNGGPPTCSPSCSAT